MFKAYCWTDFSVSYNYMSLCNNTVLNCHIHRYRDDASTSLLRPLHMLQQLLLLQGPGRKAKKQVYEGSRYHRQLPEAVPAVGMGSLRHQW